mmetsp:Transcript_62697/g.178021  ORF Transcript_62697/g.178021 Transcript_62697/m.178021 type:complete len:619 (-) Transcript_62697:6-1862(-)
MENAVAALEDAIRVLEDSLSGSSLAQEKATELVNVKRSFQKVIELGRLYLSQADVQLLERASRGGAPDWEWRKLNRQATFKMKYTPRSTDIVGVLRKMRQTFAENLAEASASEAGARASHAALQRAKEGVLSAAQAGLVSLVKEYGARGLSKSQAQQEAAELGAQVSADTEFIRQVESAHTAKAAEWRTREGLRQQELAAVSEAIAVLHSDDARDTFKKSYQSQGFSLLQVSAGHSRRIHLAAGALRLLAVSTRDSRVASMMTNITAGNIAQVVQHVDQLVSMLRAEDNTDLANKESCESERARITQQARMQSLAVDSLTENIERADEKVAEMIAQIKEQDQVLLDLNNTRQELRRQRADEARQYENDKADDHAAVQLILEALTIIEQMVQKLKGGGDNVTSFAEMSHNRVAVASAAHAVPGADGAVLQGHATQRWRALVQLGRSRQGQSLSQLQPVEVQAGTAPPPPPATWEDPAYKGHQGESAGILSILTLIKEDIERDITLAQSNEAAAISAFNTQTSDIASAERAASDAAAQYLGVKGTAEQEAVDKHSERVTKKGELESSMLELTNLQPGCDYILVNIAQRTRKRQAEIDGLLRAKALLQGAGPSASALTAGG